MARRPKVERNTYRLPAGEPLRKALVATFRTQRKAVVRWIRTGETKDGPPLLIKVEPPDFPLVFPGWDAFGLGRLAMSERLSFIISAVWDKAGAMFAPRVGLDPNEWSVVDPHTRAMIESATLAFCDKTLATTSLDVETALKRTRAELIAGVVDRGESVEQLTKRIGKVFDKAETWRARAIAQTETSRAVHAAQERTAYQSGVVAGWKWLLSDDACPLCQTVARRAPAVRLGQPFAVLGPDPNYGTVKFPPLHPHCNCTVEEVLDVDAASTSWSETLMHPEPEDEDEPDDE